MALFKEIELDNGIIVKYHRITALNKITNVHNIVEISSYTSEKEREKEINYQTIQTKNLNLKKGKSLTQEEQENIVKGINVYIKTTYLTLPYNEKQTIEEVYEYLKETEMFKNSKNV